MNPCSTPEAAGYLQQIKSFINRKDIPQHSTCVASATTEVKVNLSYQQSVGVIPTASTGDYCPTSRLPQISLDALLSSLSPSAVIEENPGDEPDGYYDSREDEPDDGNLQGEAYEVVFRQDRTWQEEGLASLLRAAVGSDGDEEDYDERYAQRVIATSITGMPYWTNSSGTGDLYALEEDPEMSLQPYDAIRRLTENPLYLAGEYSVLSTDAGLSEDSGEFEETGDEEEPDNILEEA